MEIQGFIEQLAGPDRKAASDALVAIGVPAIRPVLDALCDEESAVDWATSAIVLRRIGRPALDPLVEAMAAAPTAEVARRCGWAHCGLEIDDLAVFLPYLRHPSPKVRANTAYVLQIKREAALAYAPDLIDLLDDPDSEVRWRVECALAELGPDVLPLLSELRRSRSASGRMRRRAREAIDAIAGPSALDDRDGAAMRRLIRIRLTSEEPEPMHLCGTWFAVPTGDRQAVLDAFGLSDPEPVTMKAGASAWNYDQHNSLADSRVYVTPRLDGRTGWCVAEQGEIVRYYDVEEADDQVGAHPAEDGYLLPHIDGFPDDAFDGIDIGDSAAFQARYVQVKKDLGIPDECHATTFAARASVDPSALGPRTRVEGHGILALTASGREHGHPRGTLEI